MSPELKIFVEGYKNKVRPKLTILDVVKDYNHEIWRKCKCGNEEDLRKSIKCTLCGKILCHSQTK